MPMTPFRVWTAMRAAEQGRDDGAAADTASPPPAALRPDDDAPPPPDGMPTPPAGAGEDWKVTP
jgi:hypothetical protein